MSVARIYKVGSPYNGSELAEVDCEQSASTMYLAHLNHPPTKLVRAGHTSWVFSTISFAPTLGAPGSMSATATTPNTDTANSGAAYFPQVARYQVTAIDDDTGQESRPSRLQRQPTASTSSGITIRSPGERSVGRNATAFTRAT
jgi:hypothetical protein